MAHLLFAIPLWLADYQLLAAALLLGVTIATTLLRQPAQRLALANASLAALAAMFLLTALPGWSLVHLLSEPAPATPVETTAGSAPTTAVAMPSPFEFPVEAFPPTAVVPNAPAPAVMPAAVTAPPAAPVNWLAILLVAYAAGSAAVVIWLIIGAILAGRVRRQATPAPPELQELLHQVCGEGKTPPELLLSPHIAAPAALGLRRPAIILPASSFPPPHSPFSIQHSQFLPILAHEWAHLQHRDLHTLAASRLLLVLLWPQPLFWLLRRTIRLDQETLADAAAADRAGRLDYAQQLLAWARTADTQRPPRLAGAVGLWEGPSQLKRRIALLLNEQFAVMRACSAAWRRACIASLAVAAVALSLVTLQPSPVAGDDATAASALSGDNTAEASSVLNTPESAPPVVEGSTTINGSVAIEKGSPTIAVFAGPPIPDDVVIDWTDRYEEAGPAEPNVYAGLCVDEQGQPLAGVDVSLFIYENFDYANLPTKNAEPAAVTTTDAAGRFHFENVATLAKDRAVDAVSKQVAVIAQAPGRAIGGSLESINLITTRGKTSRLPLVPAATFSGRVTDVSGHPIAGAVVATGWGHLIPNSGLLTRTDAEGRYRLESMPPATPVVPASIIVTHPDYVAKFAKQSSNSSDFDVQLRRGSILTGRVVYKSPDRNVERVPVAGVRVWAVGELKENPGDEADGKRIAVTDADGRYELRGLVGGKYHLNASAPDRVTQGLAYIQLLPQALAVQPLSIEVPDLILTDGAIVRVKLIDAATGKPLAVSKGTNAFITPTRKTDLPLPYAQRFPCPVDEQAETELRLPPGQYDFFALIPATAEDHAWTTVHTEAIASGDDAGSLKLVEGDAVEVTMAMEPYFPPKVYSPGSAPPPSLDLQIPSLSPRYYPAAPAGVGAPATPMPIGAFPTVPPATTAVPLQVGATIQPPLPAQAAPLQAAAAADAIMLSRGIRPRPDAVEPNVIQGRCVDEQDKPLAGMALDLYRGQPFRLRQKLVASTKTNAQGEYRFDDVVDIAKTYPNGRIPTTSHSGAPMFVWVARHPGRVSRESAAMLSEAASRGQTVDLLMPAAASLTGVVRDAAGQPIAGALIARRGRMAIASDFATARSDADGKFSIDDLPRFDAPDETKRQAAKNELVGVFPVGNEGKFTFISHDALLFTATHPDYQFKNLPLTDIPAEIEIVLEPAARIAGRVVLPDGAPAAGINVLVQNSLPKRGDWGMIDYDQYEMEREYQAAVKTDTDGRFEVSSLQPGKFDLWVEAPGWLNAGQGDVEVAAGQTTSVPDLKLTKGGTIKVQALQSGVNKPLNHIAGGQVVAQVLMKHQIGRQHPVEQRVPLAADGTFTLASLPGTAMVRLEAIEVDDEVRWLPASNEYKVLVIVDVKAGETVEAKLPVKEVAPPNAIYKPVQPPGQSTSDATLQMVPAVGPAATPIPSTTGAQIAPAPATPTAAAAETRHQSIGAATFALVPLNPAEPSTENANKLEMNIIDEQGAPLAGVEALIYRAAPHNAPGKPVLLRTLATDAEGTLLVADLVSAEEVARFQKIKADGGFLGGLEGGFLIALRRPGLATAAIFQAAGPLGLYGADRTIKMRPAAKLSGRVTDPAGKPVAGAKIIAGGDLFGGVAIEGVNAAVTDADGRYEFADRAAFNRAEANKQRNAVATAALAFKTSPQAPTPTTAEDPSVSSVSDLLVSHPDYAFTRIEGGDVPGVVDIRLLPSASIVGRVIHHGSGAPAAGVIVHADGFPNGQKIEADFPSHSSGHSAVTTTDASGAYRISNLPKGQYDVWADSGAKEMSDAPWVSRGHGRIEAMPGSEPAQVPDLVIGAPAVVQVQLVDVESGEPVELPAGAKVTVATENVDGLRFQLIPQQRIAATTDGRFDMRLLPGRSRLLLFVHEGGLGSRAIWQTDDDVNSTGRVFDVKFGETASAAIPVLATRRVEELRERDMAANKLMGEKKYAEAIAAYTALIDDFPKNHFRVLQQRGHAYNRMGDYAASLADFEASLKLAPDDAGTKFWIASLLATTPVDADRDSRRALEYAEQLAADARAEGVNPQWLASVLDIQAAAHADLGNFEKAIEVEQEAIQIGNQMQRKQMESRLELYQAKKTYRLSPPAPAP